jgi:hypothetical protein
MSPSRETVGSAQPEIGVQNESLQYDESRLESDLEARIRNLGKVVERLHRALPQESFSGKAIALDLVHDLQAKIAASNNLFRVARLLSEPARESLVAAVRDSVNDLEEVIASNFSVEMTQPA